MTPALENPSGATTLLSRLKTILTSAPYTAEIKNLKRDSARNDLNDEGKPILCGMAGESRTALHSAFYSQKILKLYLIFTSNHRVTFV